MNSQWQHPLIRRSGMPMRQRGGGADTCECVCVCDSFDMCYRAWQDMVLYAAPLVCPVSTVPLLWHCSSKSEMRRIA